MPLNYLVYVSSSYGLMKKTDLDELLRKARENNVRDNITGMLLYKDGSFMQAMEGEEANVARLHDKILMDSRHRSIITLLRGTLKERQFSEWSMAFTNIDSLSQTERDGFSPFLNEAFTADYFGENPHSALKLLLSFKKNLRR